MFNLNFGLYRQNSAADTLTKLKHSATILSHLPILRASTMKFLGINMESPYKGKTGLKRVWSALFYSLAGLRAAIHHEDAFRQEVLLALILVPTALFMPVSAIGKALMIASVLLVLIVELLNSAVEAAVDHTSLDQHQLAKRAKDIGSAAVLLSLLNVVSVWLLILLN
jgi:diacylglycerol kinase (ATP)